jgi:hypothetical protein
LIVTEGEKTEPNYLNILRERLQIKAAEVVVVHPEGTDPITLVNDAIARRDERAAEAKKNTLKVAYDEVWIVFDLEKKHDIRRKLAEQARMRAQSKEIQIAQSDPSFEYWLLLHKEYTTAPLTNSREAKKRLKEQVPDYEKNWTPPPEFLEKIPTAVTNARRCRKHHEDVGGDRNPSTDVDLLVCELNAAARSDVRFDIPG